MAQQTEGALSRQLNEAFEAFRMTLQQMLEIEAQRSVDEVLARLRREAGPFRVEGADIQVVVRDLKLVAGSAGTAAESDARSRPAPRRQRRAGAPSRAGRSAGTQRRGGVREALLGVVEESGKQIDMDGLREALSSRGVEASTANLHQQLRRLTQSGEIERVGRGMYRKARRKRAA
jgi:hypothetical protein